MPRGRTVEVEQEELPNMPPASPMGKAARALMSVRDEWDEVVGQLEKKEKAAKDKLLELMEADGKEAIVVNGVTFRKVHKGASDEIRVLVNKSKGRKAKGEEEGEE